MRNSISYPLFDFTHSHHLIDGLELSCVFVVCQCDQNVTCERIGSPLIPNYPVLFLLAVVFEVKNFFSPNFL